MRSRRDRSGGFSLVEVLVALTVTGMVVMGASGLTSLVRDAEGRFDGQASARDQIIAANRILRDLVTSAVPTGARDGPTSPVSGADRLVIRTMGRAIMALDRPTPVTLAVRDRPQNLKALVAVWRDEGAGADREETVVDGARAISFSYFGAHADETPSWRSSWPNAGDPPRGVLLKIDHPSLGPPIEFLARTFTRFPEACIALPHDPGCRRNVSADQGIEQ